MLQLENPGYILRISRDEWLEQVFRLNKYYTGIIRDYKRGTPILLAKKAERGDSFVGYGVVDKVEMLWEMPPEEEDYSRGHGWKCGLTLRGLTKFATPYPIRESCISSDPRRGAFLNGAKLTEDQVDTILEAAEDYQG